MSSDPAFRRNLLVIGAIHVLAIMAVYFASRFARHKSNRETVMWLEGGSVGGGEQSGEVAPASNDAPAPATRAEPPPPPAPPAPQLVFPPEQAPSEIVTKPTPTPKPSTPRTATPRPETPHIASPRPATPKQVTPKPTPKPTPKRTPKPKPATPKPETTDGNENATPKPKASPAENPGASPATPRPDGAGGTAHTGGKSTGPTGGNGVGNGNGKGPGKAGNGSGASEYGWYFSMIHDRFHSRWDQPTNITRGAQGMVTTLRIRIGKDGNILDREIVHSSGDTTMDQSVMTAAERVQQIDPLPSGLGNGDSFEINIAFKLDQAQ